MLINFSNHPYENWPTDQFAEAITVFGCVKDIAFPQVTADADEAYVEQLAQIYTERIVAANPNAILVQGEFGVAFSVIVALLRRQYPVIYACTQRIATEERSSDGRIRRESYYRFVRFRHYQLDSVTNFRKE